MAAGELFGLFEACHSLSTPILRACVHSTLSSFSLSSKSCSSFISLLSHRCCSSEEHSARTQSQKLITTCLILACFTYSSHFDYLCLSRLDLFRKIFLRSREFHAIFTFHCFLSFSILCCF